VYEIRIHGLGGEGVVKLSDIIGKTATRCGQWAHSFPFFGTEVRGAAVKAFTRVSSSPISIKSYIYEPDVIIVTNEILMRDPETLKGLKQEGSLLINTARKGDDLRDWFQGKVSPIPATALAYDIFGKPMVNIILFGSFLGITKLFPLEAASEIVSEEFSKAEQARNLQALTRGYEEIGKVS
jgi:pyruvate ferredoxin oxidoreductase gamma subunit